MTDPSTYPPYDPDAECPKCLHDEVSTRYIKAPLGESLHRCCERCGYGWNEQLAVPLPRRRK